MQQNELIQSLNETLEQKVAERTAELQQKATALSQSNEEIKRLAYITSHDLREPLRNIASFTQLLERSARKGDFERVDEYSHYIQWAVRRMDRLTNDITAYTTEIERVDFETMQVDVGQIVKNVLIELHPLINKQQASIYCFEESIILEANTKQLRLLFYNLLENALLHTQAFTLTYLDNSPIQSIKLAIQYSRQWNRHRPSLAGAHFYNVPAFAKRCQYRKFWHRSRPLPKSNAESSRRDLVEYRTEKGGLFLSLRLAGGDDLLWFFDNDFL